MDMYAQTLEELKKHEVPAIIYGAGISAGHTADWLSANGVEVAGYVVDKPYFTKGQTFRGKPVYSIDNIYIYIRHDSKFYRIY